MLIKKLSPVGIDISIQGFQSVLYTLVKKVWQIADDVSYDCYGRIYRLPTTDGFVPEAFNGVDYTELLTNDKIKALSFFGVEDTQTYQVGGSTAKVFLVFMVDLKKIKPSITDHRPDEEVRVDIQNICVQKRFDFSFTGIETGTKVFRDYSGIRVTDIKYSDMGNLHYFRLNFDVLYSIHDC